MFLRLTTLNIYCLSKPTILFKFLVIIIIWWASLNRIKIRKLTQNIKNYPLWRHGQDYTNGSIKALMFLIVKRHQSTGEFVNNLKLSKYGA